MDKDDEEISIDFSKVKKFFKREKKEDTTDKISAEEEKKETSSESQGIMATYTQEEGNLKEMEEKLKADTGSDSDVSKTLDECEQSKQDIIKRCQQ